MADNDNNGIVILGIGLLLGTIFTYIILHRGSPAPPPQIQYLPFPYPRSAQPDPSVPGNIISVVPVPSWNPPSCTPSLIPPPIPTIQNEETWEIKKDKRGRLDKITVHRQVRPLGSSMG